MISDFVNWSNRSRSTNAWILSGGTHTGAMKLVGEAVKEGQYLVPNSSGTNKKEKFSSFACLTIPLFYY